jgi:hypothetical protein
LLFIISNKQERQLIYSKLSTLAGNQNQSINCQSGVKNISAIPLTEMHQFIFNSEKRRRVQQSP